MIEMTEERKETILLEARRAAMRHLRYIALGIDLEEVADEDKGATIPLGEETIKEYLDGAIRKWRRKRDNPKIGNARLSRLIPSCYIDAFQSVRTSLFGETLPEEGDET